MLPGVVDQGTEKEHSSVRPVCVAKRRRLSSYRCDELDLQAIVSDLQFLEVGMDVRSHWYEIGIHPGVDLEELFDCKDCFPKTWLLASYVSSHCGENESRKQLLQYSWKHTAKQVPVHASEKAVKKAKIKSEIGWNYVLSMTQISVKFFYIFSIVSRMVSLTQGFPNCC